MSLRLRLTVASAAVTAALAAIAGLAFIGQLTSSLNSALDSSLRARTEAVAAWLVSQPRATGTSSAGGPFGPSQAGNQVGQFSGTEDIVQVLAPSGAVLYPAGAGTQDPLLPVAQLSGVEHGPLTVTTTVEGERVRMLATQMQQRGKSVIMIVGVPTDVADTAHARALMALLIGGPLAILIAAAAAWLLTGAALRPVDRLRRRLDEISEHDPTARLGVPRTRDELASLAVTMNKLLERLQRALTRQRGFVADAGHELRTPLTALKAELQLAARPGKSKAALASSVTAAANDTDRLIRLAEDLLLLAQADEGSEFLVTTRADIAAVISAATRGFTPQAQARGVSIAAQTQDHLVAVADPDRLRQALDNVIDNAIRYAPQDSTVEISSTTTFSGARSADAGQSADAAQSADAQQPFVAIQVRDHGPGFPPDFLPHAFERFQRSDHARGRSEGGAGLGLSIVASIAAAHGGRAIASNHPSGGAVIRIEIPLAGPAANGSHG